MARFILEQKPDILGIQEGLDHQVSWLDSVLTEYAWIGLAREDGKRQGEYCAIFYRVDRLQLKETKTLWLSPEPERPSIGWDAALPRIATIGRWEDLVTGKIWIVYNTHFDHRGPKARLESARLLDSLMSTSSNEGHSILMGDLNATPEELPVAWLNQSYRDVLNEIDSLVGPPGTFSGFHPALEPEPRIDYIFLDKGRVRVMNAAIQETCHDGRCLSDHRPVWCRLTAY